MGQPSGGWRKSKGDEKKREGALERERRRVGCVGREEEEGWRWGVHGKHPCVNGGTSFVFCVGLFICAAGPVSRDSGASGQCS